MQSKLTSDHSCVDTRNGSNIKQRRQVTYLNSTRNLLSANSPTGHRSLNVSSNIVASEIKREGIESRDSNRDETKHLIGLLPQKVEITTKEWVKATVE